ncbi:MAG: EamA family transporter, partial [Bacteroidales bacterium]|nr:EamA family transporter [Bacteroidales bacterium]
LNGWQTVGVLAAFVAFFMLSAASSREGIRFARSKGVAYMAVSVLSGVASALWDKLIMRAMPPIYVLSHTNLYIALLMLVLFGALRLWTRRSASGLLARDASQPFIFDVNLLLISLFISGADFFYYLALQQEGALLSIISVSRRLSVVVTFLLGAVFLRERNIGRKALALGLLLAALLLILFGS